MSGREAATLLGRGCLSERLGMVTRAALLLAFALLVAAPATAAGRGEAFLPLALVVAVALGVLAAGVMLRSGRKDAK